MDKEQKSLGCKECKSESLLRFGSAYTHRFLGPITFFMEYEFKQ